MIITLIKLLAGAVLGALLGAAAGARAFLAIAELGYGPLMFALLFLVGAALGAVFGLVFNIGMLIDRNREPGPGKQAD